MKVHTALAHAFIDNDVDTMFGLVGDANLFVVESFINLGGRYYSAAHEAAATSMADGFARVTGRLGFVSVTHGPGLMNTINALREAVQNRTPMVLLCGDTPTEERQHIQDVDQRALLLAAGAGFEQVRSARTAVSDVAIAIRRALVERRPVALNVPLDLEWEETEYRSVRAVLPPPLKLAPDLDALDEAMGIIASANRPLIIAGRGALGTAARAEINRLAERLGAPVATTLLAKELFGDVPFDLGICGTLSTPAAVDVIMSADCVVVFGAGLNKYTTVDGALLGGKRVVHCDLDPARIGQWSEITVGIVGDAATVAKAMSDCLAQADLRPSAYRAEAQAALAAYATRPAFEDRSTADTIDLRTFIQWLDVALPSARTLVFDAGRFFVEPARKLHVDPRHRLFGGLTSGTIGQGMATAVGAAVGSPSATAVAIVGDGGFMLGGLNAFNDAVRHGLDVVAVVLNDGSYGAEYIQLKSRDLAPELSLFAWPDFAPLAEALGGTGVTVRNPGDLAIAAKVLDDRHGPVLIDVKIDPALVPDKHNPDA